MDVGGGVMQIWQGPEWLTILVALCVKSIIILATAAFLNRVLRSASARFRHGLWCVSLCSLLLLPLFSGDFHLLSVPALPSSLSSDDLAPRPPSELPTFEPAPQTAPDAQPILPLADTTQTGMSFSWQSIVLSVWLIGMLLVLARFVVGLLIVRGHVLRASELTGTWSDLSAELSQMIRLNRRVRLLRSDKGVMPMTCGSLSATVLLPVDADGWSADRRQVVLLHELIHVKRRDILTQSIAQVVCALYWFNPLVWWSVRKMRTEQEWACDESVVETGVTAPDYAAHLLDIARRFDAKRMLTITTTGMATSSQLQDRLCAILRPVHRHHRYGRTIAVVIVMGIVLTSAAVVQLVPAQRHDEIPVVNAASDLMRVEQIESLGQIKLQSAKVPAIAEDRTSRQTPLATPTPLDRRTETESNTPPSVVAIDNQTKEQDFSRFSAEERDRLASQGVGPAYIKEMADAGYSELTVDQLIALFRNSVRADYIAGLRSVGYDHVPIRDLLSLKTNGITPQVINSYHAVKHASFEAKRYVALVSNGVTPSYLKSLADTGYDSLTANKAIAMRLAGITADFIGDARRRGYVNLSPNDLIDLKRREKD